MRIFLVCITEFYLKLTTSAQVQSNFFAAYTCHFPSDQLRVLLFQYLLFTTNFTHKFNFWWKIKTLHFNVYRTVTLPLRVMNAKLYEIFGCYII